MQRKISELDFSNEMDIIFAYKNIDKSPSELLKRFANLKVKDYNFGLFIFGNIERACLAELSEYFHDKEMDKMLEMLIHCDKENTSDKIEVNCKDQNEKNITHLNSESLSINDNIIIDSPIGDLEIVNSTSQTSDNNNDTIFNDLPPTVKDEDEKDKKIDDSTDSKLYIKNLNILLKPIIGVCNKQIVNLIYYIYRTTGINHFEFLFKEFTEDAQRVELHLLVAKAIKGRPFDLSDVREALENTTSSNEENLQQKITLEGIFDSKDEAQPIIPLPFLDKDDSLSLSSTMNLKPFKLNMNFDFQIDSAKKILLGSSCFAYVFLIENLANFLSLKFDKEIFKKLIDYSYHDHFCLCLNRLPSVPYFFYENVDICDFLSSFSKTSHFQIKPNCYLLKSFLDFSSKFFLSAETYPISFRVAFAKTLKIFVEEYKSIALFDIFCQLIQNRSIFTETKTTLLNDIGLYMDVFYNNRKLNKPTKIKGWHLDKANDLTIISKLDDTLENLTSAFHNTSFYQEESNSISEYLLYRFHRKQKNNNRKKVLENLILDASADSNYKSIILKNIDRIFELIENNNEDDCSFSAHSDNSIDTSSNYDDSSSDESIKIYGDIILHTPEEQATEDDTSILPLCTSSYSITFKQILSNLMIFPEFNWRYKKDFISMAESLKKFGITREWIIQTFSRDRVFYIRNMIKDLSK